MKKPNFDFSKEGLKRFFLLHSEKVILGVAVVLTGVFFWLGFQTEVFSEKKPAQLSQMASDANNYIVNANSWERLKDKRQGDDTVHLRIQNSNTLVNVDQLLPNYADGLITGVPERTLAKRADPNIILPSEMVARSFRASLLLKAKRGNEFLEALPIAGSASLEDEEDEKRKRRDEEPALGTEVPEYQTVEKNGVRPRDVSLRTPALAVDRYVNVVTGVIDMDAQWAEFEQFKNSMGYYPPRDKPNYSYLKIERWDSESKKWSDVTKDIRRLEKNYIGKFPQLDSEGNLVPDFASAPELVAPQHYDPILTGPIPSFTQFDYSPFVNHVGNTELAERTYSKDVGDGEGEEDDDDEGDVFDFDGGHSDPADNKQGADQGMAGNRRGGGNQVNRNKGEEVLQRTGSADILEYIRMAKTAKKQTKYKLVRFFDILKPSVKAGTTFKYRVQVWMDDPNNERPKGEAKRSAKGRGGDNLSVGGFDGGGGAMEREGGGSGGGGGGATGQDGAEPEETYTYVKAEEYMKLESVRERVAEAKSKNLSEEFEYARTALDEDGNELWSDETNEVAVGETGPNAYVYAGDIKVPRQFKIENRRPIDAGQRTVTVAVKSWQAESDGENPDLGVPTPGRRDNVYASDVLDFVTNSHILHPVDWSVRLAENMTIKSSNMVVDIMGGDEVKAITPRVSSSALFKMKYNMPGELLVMDFEKMQFRVQNDIDDKRDFLHTLMLPDEASAVGGKRKKEDKDDDDDQGGRGGRGGQGGDDPFGGN